MLGAAGALGTSSTQVHYARKRRRSSVVLLTTGSGSVSPTRNPDSASVRDPMRSLGAPRLVPSRTGGDSDSKSEREGPSHRDRDAQAGSGIGAHVDSEITMSQVVPPGAPVKGKSRWDLDLDAGGASSGSDRLGRLVLEAQALVADSESNLDNLKPATASGTGSDGGLVNVTDSQPEPDSDAELPLPSQVDKSHYRLAGGDHQLPLALAGRRRHLCSLCPYQAKSRWEVSAYF